MTREAGHRNVVFNSVPIYMLDKDRQGLFSHFVFTDEKTNEVDAVIDAAKKKNQFFFDKFSKNLKEGGTIIVDNMNLQDLWLKINVKKRAKYNQINQDFKDYICSLKDYNVEIFDNIGDGIAVITKK
jgi:predicted O-methyltransferase YrrM